MFTYIRITQRNNRTLKKVTNIVDLFFILNKLS